jgi:hypothetical protein
MLKIVLALVLAAHGIGHILFLTPLLGVANWGQQSDSSWLLGAGGPARLIGILLFGVALVGFLAAALGLLGVTDWWRTVAIISAIVSLVGTLLFFANPPTSSVIAATVFNALVLVLLLVVHWPTDAALA